jgi:hypothetical protein
MTIPTGLLSPPIPPLVAENCPRKAVDDPQTSFSAIIASFIPVKLP